MHVPQPLQGSTSLQNPHDTLFRFTFHHAAHAASWLRSAVPSDVATAIDWSTLSLVDEWLPGLHLRPHLADLVFVAALHNNNGHLLILVEHKSYRSKGVFGQMLRYAVLLQKAFQQRHGALPLVLPILLQHGKPPGRHDEHVHLGLFAPWQPSIRILIDDLTERDEANLRIPGRTELAELTLLALRFLPHCTPAEVPHAIDRWQELMRAIDRAAAPPKTPPMGRDAIDAIGWYTLAVTDVTPEVLSSTFGRILHRPDETIMSTLERTYQKGKVEGKAEGKAEGRTETLLRQLDKRFGTVDDQVTARVRAGSTAELDAWTDRILDAPTLVEVLDGPKTD